MADEQKCAGVINLSFDWRKTTAWVIALILSYLSGRGFPVPTFQPPQSPPVWVPQPSPVPPVVIPPVVPPKETPKADPIGAIVKVRNGNSGCTGIHLGDIAKSGHSYWLTASHCTGRLGSTIHIITQTGVTLTAQIVSRDTSADVAVARTAAQTDYPFAEVAESIPEKGTEVWHKGKGVNRPNNIEKGIVTIPVFMEGRTAFRISFSSGDSGSAICRKDNGKIVGVCHGSSNGHPDGANVDSIHRAIANIRHDTPREWELSSPSRTGPVRRLLARFRR